MISRDCTTTNLRSRLSRGKIAIISQKAMIDAMGRRGLDTNEAETFLGRLISAQRILRKTLADLEHEVAP